MITKRVVVGFLTGVALYCAFNGLGENKIEKEDNIYVVILEWNLAIVGLLWLLTFTMDWQGIYLVLKGDLSSSVKSTVNENN